MRKLGWTRKEEATKGLDFTLRDLPNLVHAVVPLPHVLVVVISDIAVVPTRVDLSAAVKQAVIRSVADVGVLVHAVTEPIVLPTVRIVRAHLVQICRREH